MFKYVILASSILSSVISFAQDHNDHHIVLKPKVKDSLCLKDCLLKANWEAHTRTFVMSTINEGELKDDYAIAFSLYQSLPSLGGIGFGIGR